MITTLLLPLANISNTGMMGEGDRRGQGFGALSDGSNERGQAEHQVNASNRSRFLVADSWPASMNVCRKSPRSITPALTGMNAMQRVSKGGGRGGRGDFGGSGVLRY